MGCWRPEVQILSARPVARAVASCAMGTGVWLQGARLGQPRVVRTGIYMVEGGLLGFVVFATFFELILDLSHFGLSQLRGTLGPAVLILAGLYLLLRRRERPVSGA